VAGSFEAMAKMGFSEACERNKDPILEVLGEAFADCSSVLEIGSGTGQHAVHFARNLRHLSWQPSDTPEYLDGLLQRIVAEAPDNVDRPVELDVRMQTWPVGGVDAVFSANALHFMSWDCVENFFRGVGEVLSGPGVLCIYGPFRYAGSFTSDSNLRFDRYLRDSDPVRGVRDFEAVDELANDAGLTLFKDVPMPANNQLLVWRR
jgi:cyclopropane fatty-acyl-phospholipid synthase-like methyltransferase